MKSAAHAVCGLLLAAAPALAQERIGPVSGQLLTKDGRHELGVGAAFSLNDAFYQKVFLGGRYAYHFGEYLALEGAADYALGFVAGSVERCPPAGGACAAPVEGDLSAVPGDVIAQGALTLQLAPVYGKMMVLAEAVVHFDLFLAAGAGAVYHRGLDASGAPVTPVAPAAVVGLGLRAVVSSWLTFRLDLRDVAYDATVRGASDWQHQLALGLSLSFFAP